MGKVQCSLIITTYNWRKALQKCLQSIAWQAVLPGEIIIADDGSNDGTEVEVENIQKKFPVPIVFLTQEKIGRRKTRIDNIAISKAKFPYLIFIDHDMVVHPDFIKDHLSLMEEGYFLNGSRYLLNENSTIDFINKDNPKSEDLNLLQGKNSMNKIRIPLLMKLLAKHYHTGESKIVEVRGCNMSFWKKDLIAVNGYDENYGEWGREDSNIAVRLYNSGIKKKSIKFGAIGYHLYHKPGNKNDDAKNLVMLQESIDKKERWTENGLDKYL